MITRTLALHILPCSQTYSELAGLAELRFHWRCLQLLLQHC
jgi:hypothetical protein